MKSVVVTANFGNKDVVSSHLVYDKCSDYYYYTDSENISLNHTKVIHCGDKNSNKTLLARKVKTLIEEYYFSYDIYTWIDGCFRQKHSLEPLLENLYNDDECDMVLVEHPAYDCAYGHANNLYDRSIITKDEYDNIKEFLTNVDFPKKFGLFATGYFSCKINEKTLKLMEEWYYMISHYSVRDQITLPYLIKKHNIEYRTIKFNDLYKLFNITEHNG